MIHQWKQYFEETVLASSIISQICWALKQTTGIGLPEDSHFYFQLSLFLSYERVLTLSVIEAGDLFPQYIWSNKANVSSNFSQLWKNIQPNESLTYSLEPNKQKYSSPTLKLQAEYNLNDSIHHNQAEIHLLLFGHTTWPDA